MNETLFLSPFLKWAGGKRWIIPKMQEIYRRELRLVDPFAGGLALPLALRPKSAVISDINPHLMNLYRWVKQGLKADAALNVQFVNDSEIFYDQRRRFNEVIKTNEGQWSAEAALLFYYLNRTGYNGLCRFNSHGGFNVPFGRYRAIEYIKDFSKWSSVMKTWDFYSGDFETLPVQGDDFIYADPPYDVEFTQFARRDFVWADQERLAHWLARHPGPVAASNQSTHRICELYGRLGFQILKLQAPRRISCTGDRTPAEEILALRNLGV